MRPVSHEIYIVLLRRQQKPSSFSRTFLGRTRRGSRRFCHGARDGAPVLFFFSSPSLTWPARIKKKGDNAIHWPRVSRPQAIATEMGNRPQVSRSLSRVQRKVVADATAETPSIQIAPFIFAPRSLDQMQKTTPAKQTRVGHRRKCQRFLIASVTCAPTYTHSFKQTPHLNRSSPRDFSRFRLEASRKRCGGGYRSKTFGQTRHGERFHPVPIRGGGRLRRHPHRPHLPLVRSEGLHKGKSPVLRSGHLSSRLGGVRCPSIRHSRHGSPPKASPPW